jgi:hypothetical protein
MERSNLQMTRTERQDLLQICRQRERVAKAQAYAVAASRRAEFQSQLARIYRWDENEVWKAATHAANEVTRQCSERIAVECGKLGIPRWAQPELCPPQWYGRGENAVAQRRAELSKVANTKIDQLLKEARHAIEAKSVEIQTRLLADGLTSDDARVFLEAIPTPAQLMPAVSVENVQKQLGY